MLPSGLMSPILMAFSRRRRFSSFKAASASALSPP